MGGVNDSGVGFSSTPSLPQSSDLEKTQAKLRQTFTAAEKFRRELDFLQKGGDPLDLKTRTSSSVSIQSTSLSDPHTEQFVTSEAKGSFAVTASPHEDSVESSGRLGASVGEPNSADNLMLFDGNNQFREVERRSANPRTNNNALSEHYSKLDVGNNAKESGESAALQLPKKSYKRRVRSRPNRDGARSKGSVHDADNQEQNCLSNSNAKPKSPNASVALKNVAANSYLGMELDGTHTVESTFGPGHGPSSTNSDAKASEHYQEKLGNHPIKSVMLEKAENLALSSRVNGFGNTREGKKLLNDVNRGSKIPKGLDSESSCTQTGQSLDGNNENELPTSVRNDNSNSTMKLNLASKEIPGTEGYDLITEKDVKIVNITNDTSRNANDSILKEEEGLKESESAMQNELKIRVPAKGSCTALETERKPRTVLGSNSTSQYGNVCPDGPPGSNETSFLESTLSVRHLVDGAEQNSCSQNNLKLATKEHEDSILEEARIIEAKRKRIAELSVGSLPCQNSRKSHWDFVLEEMSWLANDFSQERLWKLTAAAQISRRVASTSRVRLQLQNSMWKQKEVAHTLAEAVMEFWHTMQVKCKDLELQCLKKDHACGLQGYALRFLKYNNFAQYSIAQAPVISNGMSDLGTVDISWEDHLTEENLFYTIPPGAIEAYRKSIESHLLQCQRTGGSMQEEVNTSGYDAVADNAYEDDEGETNTYYLPGAFEGSKSSKAAQRKRKNFKSYGARSYEMGGDLSFMPSVERNITTQPSVLSGKRPATNLNVSHLTKRVRTASRQRVISPFNAGTSGYIQVPNTTDASSGDTNSFQDEQSFLHGESQIPSNMEAESVGDYENQLHFDSMEASNRPKKKKKTKHPGSMFEHRWLDSNSQNDQKDQSKRRLDTHPFDSNGNSGLFGQHIMKKSKMMRQSLENSSDDFTPLAGSIPSPVASQMSNMSNTNKFMKLLVRDRSRKAKALKTAAGQPGLGSPWSLFEDQALVVLVHDMGPNWELISDAINSTLQFKCIFRKSIECKERHKILMDTNNGDGADSADDSGSSQPYPSTLRGIPEGSARQLFQRLQGPMEEDTLKSHFEKIFKLGQKHYRRTQNDNQDPKQLQQPHSSHTLALSQVCPNNLNGGPVLTPLELCEAIASSPDVLSVGYQGPHSGGLPVPNQGTIAPMLPGSSSTSPVPGPSNVVLSNHLSSASAPLNPAVRDGRYGIPRTGSLSVDDQQRIQQYNQMLSARNMQQNSLPLGSHSVTDRGVRVLPPGNPMGVMNRGMPMARPGFQGITSSSMLNSGNMPTSGMPMPAPGQGNSTLRPREAMHMMRPNQNTDHQRQIMAPELQMQQGLNSNSHHTPHLQGPPNHPTNSHHPAYGMRFSKERQLQQQRLLQQQFATSNAMMPHVQPQQSQIPVSSPQNSTLIPPQSSSPSVSLMGTPAMPPVSQMPQKHPVHSPQGLVRNPQMVKQQQRQRFQQPGRQHPQQRQQPQPQQMTKLVKGGGRGMMIHQNLPVDPSLLNGFSGGQSGAEKGVYSGSSGLNPVVQASSSSPSNQKKTFSGQLQQQKPDTINDKNSAPLATPSSISPSLMTSNHQEPHPQPRQKLSNQPQAMASQRMVQSRQVGSPDQHPMPLSNPSQTSTSVPVPRPPSNDATISEMPAAGAPNWKVSEPFYDSSAAMPDKATQFPKVSSIQMSPPQTNSGGTGGEHPGPAVSQNVVHRQSSSDSLPNPVGPEAGVQWQQQQQQQPSS